MFHRRLPLEILREIMDFAVDQVSNSPERADPPQTGGLELSDDEDEEEPSKENDESHPHDYKWSPLDPLCGECFVGEFRQFYYSWWLNERSSDRVEGELVFILPSYVELNASKAYEFREGDCWWGLECRTQRRKDHAEKRNVRISHLDISLF